MDGLGGATGLHLLGCIAARGRVAHQQRSEGLAGATFDCWQSTCTCRLKEMSRAPTKTADAFAGLQDAGRGQGRALVGAHGADGLGPRWSTTVMSLAAYFGLRHGMRDLGHGMRHLGKHLESGMRNMMSGSRGQVR